MIFFEIIPPTMYLSKTNFTRTHTHDTRATSRQRNVGLFVSLLSTTTDVTDMLVSSLDEGGAVAFMGIGAFCVSAGTFTTIVSPAFVPGGAVTVI